MIGHNQDRVTIRCEIVEDLYQSIKTLTTMNLKYRMTKTLNKIARTPNFSVDTNCYEVFYHCGEDISVTHVKIIEKVDDYDYFVIRIYTDDRDEIVMKYDETCLRIQKELEDEARFEIEADEGMSQWARGYRPHLDYIDDPRGY